jgi:hypothetical protein
METHEETQNVHRESGKYVCYTATNTKVDEICGLLGYYAASNGNPIPTFPYNVSVPFSRAKDFLTLEDGPDTLSRNVGKGLPSSLRNTAEEGRYQNRGGSLKSRIVLRFSLKY